MLVFCRLGNRTPKIPRSDIFSWWYRKIVVLRDIITHFDFINSYLDLDWCMLDIPMRRETATENVEAVLDRRIWKRRTELIMTAILAVIMKFLDIEVKMDILTLIIETVRSKLESVSLMMNSEIDFGNIRTASYISVATLGYKASQHLTQTIFLSYSARV